MSRIDDLIKELAPKGVPIQPLGEVGVFIRGRRFTKADRVDDGLPSIHYGEIYTHYGVATSDTISHVRADLAPTLRFARPGDVIIAAVGETVEDVGKAVAWLGTAQVAVHDDCFIFRSSLDPKFVVYLMQSDAFNKAKEAFVARAKVKRLSSNGLARLRIPLPPIEVQREIVRVLDQLTELQARLSVELQAELEARRTQYAHYRDSLLTSGEAQPEVFALGNIAEFKYGFTAKAQAEGDYRFIRITDINRQGKLSPNGAKFVNASTGVLDYIVKPGDLLMARTGATYGKTMLVSSDEPAVYASFLIRIRLDENVILPAYYWHFAQSHLYWTQANAMVSTGGQPQFNANVLKRIEVPVPSLEEQKRIVTALDKFDALVSDLSSSLPAELNARRKQYEYYREKLLTFEELAS